jgi:hypothetical protein
MVAAGLTVYSLAACQSQGKAATPVTPANPPQPTLTIKEIMKAMVEPSSQTLWDSVATYVSDKGSETKVPKNDKEWAEVRRNGIVLAEAMNLIVMEPRHVAPAGTKSENPGSELEPDQMETRINQDRAKFAKLARELQDTAVAALKTIDAKDPEALSNAGGDIDAACESCHKTYWYPDKKAG